MFVQGNLICERSLPIQNKETWICQFEMLDNYLSKNIHLKSNRSAQLVILLAPSESIQSAGGKRTD